MNIAAIQYASLSGLELGHLKGTCQVKRCDLIIWFQWRWVYDMLTVVVWYSVGLAIARLRFESHAHPPLQLRINANARAFPSSTVNEFSKSWGVNGHTTWCKIIAAYANTPVALTWSGFTTEQCWWPELFFVCNVKTNFSWVCSWFELYIPPIIIIIIIIITPTISNAP